MSASGPVNKPKMFPAATHADQLKIEEGGSTPIVLGTPPFSSPDPATDALKMLPLEDGTSAYEAAQEAAGARASAESGDYGKMSKTELVALAEERDVDATGMNKKEIVAALQEDDASDMKAADFKEKIEAASTQEELDAVGELYEASGKEYSSVEDAFEKKQDEINEAGTSSDNQ